MDFDAKGALTFTEGDIISRHGISWKIMTVEQELSMGNLSLIPTYWIYLSPVVVN